MYVGRIVCVGRTSGRLWAGYRVSSRSFPHRHAVRTGADTIAVRPKDARDLEASPFLAYNCMRITPDIAVIGNGSHTDPIVEKLMAGYPARDALALSLLALDYEKDALRTPRIAAALAWDRAYLGIVTAEGLNVTEFQLAEKDCFMVATYERTVFSRLTLEAVSARDVAEKLYGLPFEDPVCAAGVFQAEGGFETAVYNGP